MSMLKPFWHNIAYNYSFIKKVSFFLIGGGGVNKGDYKWKGYNWGQFGVNNSEVGPS